MTATIRVNTLTLAHKGTGGYARSTLPDVCKSPTAPVPYVNTSFISTLTKGTRTIFADGGNMIANKGSEQATSIGDEPGVGKGVKSGTQLDRATWLSWSPDVFMETRQACRLTDKMLMNNGNTVCLAGHWDPKIKGNKTLEELCKEACECVIDHPDPKPNELDQCFQDRIRKLGYDSDLKYPKPETMDDGFLTNVTWILVNGKWQIRESDNVKGMPSSNPYSPKGSIRPDIIVRRNGESQSIVEMKFGSDTPSENQLTKYPQARPTKFLSVDKECDCEGYRKDKEEESELAKAADKVLEKVEQNALAAAAMRFVEKRWMGPISIVKDIFETSPAY